jgi:hypothetical protein
MAVDWQYGVAVAHEESEKSGVGAQVGGGSSHRAEQRKMRA